MADTAPTLGQLRALLLSSPQDVADDGLAALFGGRGGPTDLGVPQQRDEVRLWLNKWVCRLRYPRPGEPDVFSDSLAAWWAASGSALPGGPVAGLSDTAVGMIADSYADLSARPGALLVRNGSIAGRRSIAPTAASKILFVLRPETVPPWDAAIARTSAGGTSRDHFAGYLNATRAWARAVQDQARQQGVTDIPAYVGRPGTSLAKLRDDWLYLTITRGCAIPPP